MGGKISRDSESAGWVAFYLFGMDRRRSIGDPKTALSRKSRRFGHSLKMLSRLGSTQAGNLE
jgi:hypothetical protein